MLTGGDLASEHGLALAKGYAEFLERFPDGVASFPLPEWPGVVAVGDVADAAAKPAAWCEHVASICGVDELDTLYLEAKADGDCHFWNRRLLPHAYVVARTFSGDPIVQVAAGKRAGAILLTNHETYHGCFEHLAAMIPSEEQRAFFKEHGKLFKKLGYTLPKEIGSDTIVEFLLHKKLDGAEVIAGSFEEFYAALGRARGVGPAPAAPAGGRIPPLPTRTQVHTADGWGQGLEACAADGDVIYFASARLEQSWLFTSTDGTTFTRTELPHPDVHDIHVRGDEMWLAGATTVMRSTDGGRTWGEPIEVPLGGKYLWGIAKDDDGMLWVLGNKGRIATSTDDGKSFAILEPERGFSVGQLSVCPLGVLIPSGGTIRIGKAGKVTTAPLEAEHCIDDILYTADGSLLTCDRKGHVHRSTDGGASWTRSRILGSPERRQMLRCLAQARTGWIAVSGGGGYIYVSFDDGRIFRALPPEQYIVGLASAVPHGDGVLFGGNLEEIVRVA